MGLIIRETRNTIHNTTVTVGGKYSMLYQQQPPSGTSCRSRDITSDKMDEDMRHPSPRGSPARSWQRHVQTSRFGFRSPSLETRSSNDGRPLPTSGHSFGSPFGSTEGAGGGFVSSGRTSFFTRTPTMQRSPTSSLSRTFRRRVLDEPAEPVAGGTAAVTAAREQMSPEEETFWSASQICKVR